MGWNPINPPEVSGERIVRADERELISGGYSELSGIGCGDALVVGVDKDGLYGGVALGPEVDGVLSCAQCADDIVGEGFFHKEQGRKPLVVDAWGRDGVGGIFACEQDV